AENVAERRHPDVENAARRGIEHLEGRDDGAAGQNLDLEAAARHLLGGFAPELEDQVEIGRGWMGRLPLENDWIGLLRQCRPGGVEPESQGSQCEDDGRAFAHDVYLTVSFLGVFRQTLT